jgi:hypothetical protein
MTQPCLPFAAPASRIPLRPSAATSKPYTCWFCFSRSRSDHTPVGFASAEAGVTIHLLVLLQPKQRKP